MANLTITDLVTENQFISGEENQNIALVTTSGTVVTDYGPAFTIANKTGEGSKLSVLGTVLATGPSNVQAIDFAGHYLTLSVGSDANVLAPDLSSTAIHLVTSHHSGRTLSYGINLTNDGSIYGGKSAIHLEHESRGYIYIKNTGNIASSGAAIHISSDKGNVHINNFGTITGATYGVSCESLFDADRYHLNVVLRNYSVVEGDSASYLGAKGNDEVQNHGLMTGAVFLGNGNDTYLGKTGIIVGDVRGQNGIDQLFGGAGREKFYGGRGNDLLEGGGNDDRLWGGKGNDVIKGGTGADTLRGGQGDDKLTGGAGMDRFVFNRNAGDDTITDFHNNRDQIDLSAFYINPKHFNKRIAPALSDAGNGDTMLDLDAIGGPLGGKGSVLIKGLAISDADASDFIL